MIVRQATYVILFLAIRYAILMQLNDYFNNKMTALTASKLLLKIKIVTTSEKKMKYTFNFSSNLETSELNGSQNRAGSDVIWLKGWRHWIYTKSLVILTGVHRLLNGFSSALFFLFFDFDFLNESNNICCFGSRMLIRCLMSFFNDRSNITNIEKVFQDFTRDV